MSADGPREPRGLGGAAVCALYAEHLEQVAVRDARRLTVAVRRRRAAVEWGAVTLPPLGAAVGLWVISGGWWPARLAVALLCLALAAEVFVLVDAHDEVRRLRAVEEVR